MKIGLIVLSVLIMQASGSFFHDIHNSFATVEQHFGKLLSDVVTDVKDTIDCTVMSVEKALSWGGMFGGYDHSEYDAKCGGNANTYATNVQQSSYKPIETRTDSIKRDLSQDIESVISSVNNTLNKFLERDVSPQIDSIENTLKGETKRLTEVSTLLRQELDRIATKMKNDVRKEEMKFDTTKTDKENIKNEVNFLYELEQQKNKVYPNEIHNVFDNVLDVLHENHSPTLSNEEQYNRIIKNIERSNSEFDEIENKLANWKGVGNKHSSTKDPIATTKKDQTGPLLSKINSEVNSNNTAVEEKKEMSPKTDVEKLVDSIENKFTHWISEENQVLKDINGAVGSNDDQNSAVFMQSPSLLSNEVITLIDDIEKSSNATIQEINQDLNTWKDKEKEYLDNVKDVTPNNIGVSQIVEDLEKSSTNAVGNIKDEISEWKKEEQKYFSDIKDELQASDAQDTDMSTKNEITDLISDLQSSTREKVANIESEFSQWKKDDNKHLEEINKIVQSDEPVSEEKNDSTDISTKTVITDLIGDLESSTREKFVNIETEFSQWKQGDDKNIEEINKIVQSDEPVSGEKNDSTDPSTKNEITDLIGDLESSIIEKVASIESEFSQWKQGDDKNIEEINKIVQRDEPDTKEKKSNEAKQEIQKDGTKENDSTDISPKKEMTDLINDLDRTREKVASIESEFSQWKQDEDKHLEEVGKIVISDEPVSEEKKYNEGKADVNRAKSKKDVVTKSPKVKNVSQDEEDEEDTFPKSFRDLFKNLLSKTSDLDEIEDKSVPAEESAALFQQYFAPKDAESHKAAVKEATEVVAKSKVTQTLMDNVFNNPLTQESAVSVFDNPDLFNFR